MYFFLLDLCFSSIKYMFVLQRRREEEERIGDGDGERNDGKRKSV